MHLVVDDLRLARRLQRQERAAARARLRAELAQARAVRRRDRARRSLPRRLALAVGAGALSLPLDGALEGVAGATSLGAALIAARALSVLREPDRAPVAVPPPPPARGTTAFPYVVRLERVRDELRRLLPLVSPAGRDAVEQAWEAAAEADLALRWQAARMAAVEPHRPVDADLRQTLADGVAGQERLLAAVADLVAASADPLATWRIQEATDALHGLAQGLRELH